MRSIKRFKMCQAATVGLSLMMVFLAAIPALAMAPGQQDIQGTVGHMAYIYRESAYMYFL